MQHLSKDNACDQLRICLGQTDSGGKSTEENIEIAEQRLLTLSGKADVLMLPEMFATGFTMKPEQDAITHITDTLARLQQHTDQSGVALYTSLPVREGDAFFNRGFFLRPGEPAVCYDKRHLFRMGHEHRHYSQGEGCLTVHYRGWKIRPIICYDLRFPVWCRNVDNAYDLLLCVACWPQQRMRAWHTLLAARAVENQAFACGVNRVGTDQMQLSYSGESSLYDYKGNLCCTAGKDKENLPICTLSLKELTEARKKFSAYLDADRFALL